MDFVNQLQELEQSEHRIEEEVEENACVGAIDDLVDADVDEPVVKDGSTDDHDVLHRKSLARHFVLAELDLKLLIYCIAHLLLDLVVQSSLVEVRHCVWILLREN